MSINVEFNQEKINFYLNEVAKEIKKISSRGYKFEIILVGGASVILNYNFRLSSNDIDGYYYSDIIKQAINNVSDKFSLPVNWLNQDFVQTNSFSSKLVEYSKYFKTYQNVLDVRTINGTYLIAMKLKAFRLYKHDVNDIIGILRFEKDKGNAITKDMINKAIIDLYGSLKDYSETAIEFLDKIDELKLDDL